MNPIKLSISLCIFLAFSTQSFTQKTNVKPEAIPFSKFISRLIKMKSNKNFTQN